MTRRIILVTSLVFTLSALTCIFAQRTQEQPEQRLIQQIRSRPTRIVAQPIDYKIADIVAGVLNLPDADLRPTIKAKGISIKNQGGRGTCSVFAMTFLLEYMYATKGGKMNPDFSEEYLNYASNLAVNQYSDGGFFDALDLGYQKYGMVNEAQVPYHNSYSPPYVADATTLQAGKTIMPKFKATFIKAWDVTTGLTDSHIQSIETTLKGGRPVAVGVRWPTNFQTETVNGIELMKTPPPSGVFDGHSIDLVGYKAAKAFPGGGYFIFRNSYGTGFGAEGYGFMSFDYAKKYVNDAVDYSGPLPVKPPAKKVEEGDLPYNRHKPNANQDKP